ncbi:MAG: MFS transporter [Actinomycetota bacterium]|nr:MFS transporter [Actinomycetota bacterium]
MPRGTVMAFVALGLSVIILANDFSALNVSLPSIEQDFDTDVSTAQWVINAYALVFGVLIVSGGRLADVLGRKRIFLIGSTIFAVMSVIGGAAPNEFILIASRALMGVGGAMMWPAILGMTYAALPPSKAGLAGGLILGSAGIGQAIGPLTGGILTEYVSWRAVLFVNLPIAAFAMLVTWRQIHQKEERGADERLDYGGIVTLSVSLFALLFALDQATDWGWSDWRILASFLAFAVLFAAFVPVERRMGRNALLPGDLARNGAFMWASIAVGLISALFFASMLYLPQYMQKVLDYSPVLAGLGMLPLFVPFAVLAFAAGPLYNRLGAKLIVSLGVLAFVVGGALLTFVSDDSGYLGIVAGLVVLGIGMGLFFPSATTAGVTAVAAARQSLAGGIVYMFQIAGGAVGLGLSTTVFTATFDDRLSERIAEAGVAASDDRTEALRGLLAGTDPAQEAAREIGLGTDRLLEFVEDAFIAGFNNVFRIDTALAFAGLLVAVVFVGGRLRAGQRALADDSAVREPGS